MPVAIAVQPEIIVNDIDKKTKYSYKEAFEKSLEYFNGDDLAAKVFVDKYALRDLDSNFDELTPDDMHHRIAKEFAKIESKYDNPMPEEEIYELLKDFKYIVPQGSPMSAIGNPYQIQSAGNCFVVESPADSYAGICHTDQQMVHLQKRRAGVGFDISNIRPSGITVQNAARTTDGIGIFMERFSNTCREVAQGGRRGALLLSIAVNHPEIETFISIKQDLKKVTGANISIRISDEFMNAVKNDEQFELRWPVDSDNPKIRREVSAKELWKKLTHSVWKSAEPGLLFWDAMNTYSPAHVYAEIDDSFRNRSTNPCGEIVMGIDSCRLLIINLLSFVKNPFSKKPVFDFDLFSEIAQKAQRLMDDLIDIEIDLILRIIKKVKSDPEAAHIKKIELDMWNQFLDTCRKGRRTGLGVTALGDTIAALNLTYGSVESIETTEAIYKTLAVNAYKSSCILAKERGAFPMFDKKIEKNHPFLDRVLSADEELSKLHSKYGRRNIALTTTAPVGTVSTLTQTTSGIEPAYLLEYTRRKKITPGDMNAKVDFTDNLGDQWQHFSVFHHGVQRWMDATGKKDIKESPYYGATSRDVDWMASVDIQAAAQKWICHSISKTCNLPNEATEDLISKVYMRAWEKGCKGFTAYREGCRDGVLFDETQRNVKIVKTHAPKRPKSLPSELFFTTVKGEHYFVVVGTLQEDNEPYEVFVGNNGFNSKRGSLTGATIRESRGRYHGLFEDDIELKNMSSYCSDEEEALTRMISTAFRHGADASFVVHQLEKCRGDLQSPAKAIARVLKKYIKDGVKVTGELCPKCKGELVRVEGCCQCKGCGWSRCS